MTAPRGWVCVGDGFHAPTRKKRAEHEADPRCAQHGRQHRTWARAKSPRGIYWTGVRLQVRAFNDAVHSASHRRRRAR